MNRLWKMTIARVFDQMMKYDTSVVKEENNEVFKFCWNAILVQDFIDGAQSYYRD